MEQRYQGVTGSVTLPSIPAFTLTKKHMPSTAGKQSNQTPNQISVSALQCVAMTGLQSQVEAVESMYRKMVRQLETLAHTASVVSPA